MKLKPDPVVFGLPNPAHLGLDKQLPGFEMAPVFGRFGEVLTEPITGYGHLRSQAGRPSHREAKCHGDIEDDFTDPVKTGIDYYTGTTPIWSVYKHRGSQV